MISASSRGERRDPNLAFASVGTVRVHWVIARDEPAAEEFITRHELHEGEWSRVILWREMSPGTQTWSFPLFLSFEHFVGPIEESDGEMPPRIHARLVRDRAE